MLNRACEKKRQTKETNIHLHLDLDSPNQSSINTPAPFLNHMLEQIAMHGKIGLAIDATGDVEIDDHHLVEDIGITLGQAFFETIGDKKGLKRYGHAYVPLDESLSRVVIDLSGRPGLFFNAHFTRPRIGNFDVDLVKEFFQGFVNHAAITLHIDQLRGANAHHQVESIFKAFGVSLSLATTQLHTQTIPSSKGVL